MRFRSCMLLLLAGFLCMPVLAKKKAKKKADDDSDAVLSDEQYQKRFEKHFKSKPGYKRWYKNLESGQIKINRIDTSEAPLLKIHTSILTGGEDGVLQPKTDWENVRRLTVKMSSGDQRKPKELVTFQNGVVPEAKEGTPKEDLPPFAEITPIEKADSPLDVVVVAAGHSRLKTVEGLESIHKTAVQSLLKGLGSARTNIYWYGPMLYTYRGFEGLEGELSRFDENLSECESERRRLLLAPSPEDDKPALPPCGLQQSAGKMMAKAVKTMRFRGKHVRLFGLRGVKACVRNEQISTAIRFYDVDEMAEQTQDSGAFEEALRMLLRYSDETHRKAIIILSDGRDGYFDDEDQCRTYFRRSSACLKQRGKKRTACVQKFLDQRSTELQSQFRDRARRWLALLRTSGIRVYSIAYAMHRSNGQPLTHAFERERLELLAQKSGGTYREVTSTQMVAPAAEATALELQSEQVITVDAGLVANSEYKIELNAILAVGAPMVSPRIAFSIGEMASGFMPWFYAKSKWLKNKVGTVLYWVIVVLIAILLLVVAWLCLKLLKGMGKGIFKLFKKVFKVGKKAQAKSGGD